MTMELAIHLLGRPRIERGSTAAYRFRSRKSWGVLARLLLSERPQSRTELAALLFDSADDPLRALRWSLAEIRRALGDDACLEGDPVTLVLAPTSRVDVWTVTRGAWLDAFAAAGAVGLDDPGGELLAGLTFGGAPAFESWLLLERRRVAAASEAVLREAALSSLARSAFDDAIDHAERLVELNPLDEEHQALLIRAYRLAGDDAAAERQLAACTAVLHRELGVTPGAWVRAAGRAGASSVSDVRP
jgi:DNA-binding SARP family transcriptional activator